MKSSGLSSHALSIGAAAALLVGCGASQPPTGAPGAMSQGSALATPSHIARYKVLHSFGYGGSDGVYPEASLIDVGGTLYGTTWQGGKYNGGTVFSITPSGVEKVLHNFGSGSDGANPAAGLIDVRGTLYGTTEYGGSYICYRDSSSSGCGTVFSITPSGKEKVLHSFSWSSLGQGSDGRFPAAPLINVNGTLYGTTTEGGAYNTYYGGGTVFAVTKTGTETVLHTFNAGLGDGQDPQAGLVNFNGTLYGTTSEGGEYQLGTVFSITLSGKEKLLHSFGQGTDGAVPYASLINVNGTLYGTTAIGGAGSCRVFGSMCGTVYSITPGGIGTEKVLHEFSTKTDGGNPLAPLIDVKGTLYGTTWSGGDYYCNVGGSNGCGSVYRISTSGAEKVQYRFIGGSDGAHPLATLVDVGGVLYGTTEVGGGGGCLGLGCGTVFALTP